MLKFIQISSVSLLLATFCISAGPKAEFDSTIINKGDIIEGTTTKIPAVFTIKNTGDAPLKLLTVKPSCGCTVVKFDSTIQPGQATKIESAVNIPGYRNGHYTKHISVKTNVNDSLTRLSIEFTIIPAIDVSTHALDFDSASTNKPQSVTLSSKMGDLKVTAVKYQNDSESVPVKYTWTKTDSVSNNGMHIFKLDLYRPAKVKKGNGNVIIATNHQNKQELTITGNIH